MIKYLLAVYLSSLSKLSQMTGKIAVRLCFIAIQISFYPLFQYLPASLLRPKFLKEDAPNHHVDDDLAEIQAKNEYNSDYHNKSAFVKSSSNETEDEESILHEDNHSRSTKGWQSSSVTSSSWFFLIQSAISFSSYSLITPPSRSSEPFSTSSSSSEPRDTKKKRQTIMNGSKNGHNNEHDKITTGNDLVR